MKRAITLLAIALSIATVSAQDIVLPKPASKLGVDLVSAISDRKVSRLFIKKDIPTADLSTILWSGLGLRSADAISSATKAGRTISFSGDNPYINLYVLTAKGSWKYLADKNELKFIGGGDSRAKVSTAAIPTAAVMILYAVDYAMTPSFLANYPALFIQMSHSTAGFAAQNVGLTASALKLASIIQYTLSAPGAAEVLKLGKDEAPLFIQQLGYAE
jgi:hypothetical protein